MIEDLLEKGIGSPTGNFLEIITLGCQFIQCRDLNSGDIFHGQDHLTGVIPENLRNINSFTSGKVYGKTIDSAALPGKIDLAHDAATEFFD